MSWDSIDKAKTANSSYVKMKDGDKIQLVVLGEPYTYYQRFKEKEEYLDYVEGSSFKFKLNVAVMEEGRWTAKILNQGITLGKAIRMVLQKYGPDTVFELKREGSGKDDTTYHILYDRATTEADKAVFKTLKLQDLKKQAEEPPPFTGEEAIPF